MQLGYSEGGKRRRDLMTAATRNFPPQKYDVDRKKHDQILFSIPYKPGEHAVTCLGAARVYKGDQETSNFEGHEITSEKRPKIEEADEKNFDSLPKKEHSTLYANWPSMIR